VVWATSCSSYWSGTPKGNFRRSSSFQILYSSWEHQNVSRFEEKLLVVKHEGRHSQICGRVWYLSSSQSQPFEISWCTSTIDYTVTPRVFSQWWFVLMTLLTPPLITHESPRLTHGQNPNSKTLVTLWPPCVSLEFEHVLQNFPIHFKFAQREMCRMSRHTTLLLIGIWNSKKFFVKNPFECTRLVFTGAEKISKLACSSCSIPWIKPLSAFAIME
jgi:hypothetical protein